MDTTNDVVLGVASIVTLLGIATAEKKHVQPKRSVNVMGAAAP